MVATAKAGKKAQPILIESRFKESLTTQLQVSLRAASDHLAWALGLREVEGEMAPTAFGRYELELEGGRWRASCEEDVDPERDSVQLCALHKAQALGTLCEVEGLAPQYRAGVKSLLRDLVGPKREKAVPGLGLKRHPLGNGQEVWLVETAPRSGNYDLSTALHAAVTLAVAQCDHALGQQEYMTDLRTWLGGLEKVYTPQARGEQPFHSSCIVWEAVQFVASVVPPGSDFSGEAEGFANELQAYLAAELVRLPKVWSFAGSRATALSFESASKGKRRKQLAKNAGIFLTRWLEIVPLLNSSTTNTCGPLQGTAALLSALLRGRGGVSAADTRQVSLVLGLMVKDVELFQVRVAAASVEAQGTNAAGLSAAAARLPQALLGEAQAQALLGEGTSSAALDGAFLRDGQQLTSEKRWSLRLDDTAQCALALARTLWLLEGLGSAEADASGGGQPMVDEALVRDAIRAISLPAMGGDGAGATAEGDGASAKSEL